ncbi:hypothetical protein [Bradyrhizobium guangdongense]
MKHLVAPDGCYIVVRRRLWRIASPDLEEDEKSKLVKQLMATRRAVRNAKASADLDAQRAAHRAVEDAKCALASGAPVWWKDGPPDLNRYMAKNTPYAEWYAAIARSRHKEV